MRKLKYLEKEFVENELFINLSDSGFEIIGSDEETL